VIIGIFSYVYLPNNPSSASWLSQSEKEWYKSQKLEERKPKSLREMLHSVNNSLRNHKVVLLSLLVIIPDIASTGLTTFFPLLIQRISNWSDLAIGFAVAFPATSGLIGKLVLGWSSDYFKERIYHIILPIFFYSLLLSMAAIAYLKSTAIVVIILLSIGYFGGVGYLIPFWAWVSNSFAGDNSAVSLAIISSFSNVGGMVGPYIVGLLAGETAVKIGQILLFVVIAHLVFCFCLLGLAKYFDRSQTIKSDDCNKLLAEQEKIIV